MSPMFCDISPSSTSHGIDLNCILNDRYLIIQKLGSGGFGHVFLAKDTKLRRYVSIKVLTSHKPSDELRFWRSIASWVEADNARSGKKSGEKGFNFAVPAEGPDCDHQFEYTGLGKPHLCLVGKVYGPSLFTFFCHKATSYGPRYARKVARNVVNAVKFLHDKQLVHGDLTLTNILLKYKDFDSWTNEEVRSRYGAERSGKSPTLTVGSKVDQRRTPNPAMDNPQLVSSDIVLIDFGVSFKIQRPSHGATTPLAYKAPEVLPHLQASELRVPERQMKCSRKQDVWSLAHVIFGIRFSRILFEETWLMEEESRVDSLVKEIWDIEESKGDVIIEKMTRDVLGDEPEDEKDKADKISKVKELHSDGLKEAAKRSRRRRENDSEYPFIIETFRPETPVPQWNGHISRVEAACLYDLLRKMLLIIPKQRLSMKEVANHPWFHADFELLSQELKARMRIGHDENAVEIDQMGRIMRSLYQRKRAGSFSH